MNPGEAWRPGCLTSQGQGKLRPVQLTSRPTRRSASRRASFTPRRWRRGGVAVPAGTKSSSRRRTVYTSATAPAWERRAWGDCLASCAVILPVLPAPLLSSPLLTSPLLVLAGCKLRAAAPCRVPAAHLLVHTLTACNCFHHCCEVTRFLFPFLSLKISLFAIFYVKFALTHLERSCNIR